MVCIGIGYLDLVVGIRRHANGNCQFILDSGGEYAKQRIINVFTCFEMFRSMEYGPAAFGSPMMLNGGGQSMCSGNP
jgi:hypothetical protein